MTEPTVFYGDLQPPTVDFNSIDTDFFSGVGAENYPDVSIDDLDLDLDFSFDDINIPDLDEFLDPTVLQQSDSQTDPKFAQFASGSDVQMELIDVPDHSSNGSGVLTSESPEIQSYQIQAQPDDLNHMSSEKSDFEVKVLSYPSPESQNSGNCGSNVSEGSNDVHARSVSSSPDSSARVGVVDQKLNLEPVTSNVNSSLLKRKKEGEDLVVNNNEDMGVSKLRKSNANAENNNESSDNGCLDEVDDKRKARLMRNRESAQLSRQRKKHYVEELEDKVKAMNAMIQDLNGKISYFMAENVTLRQQLGGAAAPPPPPMVPPPPGMYPHPGMMYPWMPYAPPYMVKPQGSQVPLVPIPRLKPQQPAPVPKVNKKVDRKKNEGTKTKKVAGVNFIGLLFFLVLFGGLVPMVNMKFGGVEEALVGGKSHVGVGAYEKHHGRVLMVNGTDPSSRRELSRNSSVQCGAGPSAEEVAKSNGSDPLVASLYVPRNNKLVKIDGNLIIHSILASEKAMSSQKEETGETGLVPALPVGRNGARHPPLPALDGKVQQWFREGFTGPMLTSGICQEVFQFDASSVIVPSTTPRNISKDQNQNSTRLNNGRNRRILYDQPIPLPDSHNISREEKSQKEKLSGNTNSSSVVVSVLVDPREVGDADVDGVLGTKSISRIFVVVLIDSVKYVTYSCKLPFMGSPSTRLVTT